ncbi:DUF1064 domain-containing protein [Pararhizobium sp. PWRC1-1]|uniref:DUF1064 domain-containing protein n=1 Tax=Pararhizobium sp. PWRC1-1 TaxID=2804566 RepID=UPI003CF042BE
MNIHLTREEGRQLLSQKKKPTNKFNAKRVLLDGICFDSKAEATYYAALKLREKANEVTDIEVQRWYDLIVNGVLVARYRADFVFFDRICCARRIVDTKGVVTRDFRVKQKLMKACFGIDVEVIR